MHCDKNRGRSDAPAEFCLPLTAHRAGPPHPAAALPGPVRGVLFDLCNVLYDNTVWRRWVLQLLSRLGVHTHYRCFFRVWDREYLGDVHRGQRSFAEAFRAFLQSVGLTTGQIDEVEAACRARRRELQGSARPLPGVKGTLARLGEAGLTLGVLCDSEVPAADHRQRLQRSGLARLLTTVVSSIDLRQTMPAAICYRTALEAMELAAAEVAFVGHDTVQLAGAARLGMPTIAVNYDPDVQADVHLAKFEDLDGVVAPCRPYAAAG